MCSYAMLLLVPAVMGIYLGHRARPANNPLALARQNNYRLHHLKQSENITF